MEEHEARAILRMNNVLIDMAETRTYAQIVLSLGLMSTAHNVMSQPVSEALIDGEIPQGRPITLSSEV